MHSACAQDDSESQRSEPNSVGRTAVNAQQILHLWSADLPVISCHYVDEKRLLRKEHFLSICSFIHRFLLSIHISSREKLQMQRTAINRGNVDAISEKQEAPTMLYHSHSEYKCQQMHCSQNNGSLCLMNGTKVGEYFLIRIMRVKGH